MADTSIKSILSGATVPVLGLAVIVRNREAILPNLLESIRGVFDQVVIADTGSKDKTREVARSYGAEVHDFKDPAAYDEEGRLDDFSAARNFSFSLIKAEWTMWLDSDDVLTPENREALLDLKRRLGKYDAYLMWYDYSHDEMGKANVFFRRHRILKTSRRPRWVEPIHEHLDMAGWNQGESEIRITHRKYHNPSGEDKGRNLRILSKAVKKDPSNNRLKYYYGKELYWEHRYEEMIQVLEEFVKVGGFADDVANAYHWISMGHFSQNRHEQAIDAAMRGIRFDPRWAEFYYVIGKAHHDRGDFGRAIPWLEIAASSPLPASWATVQPDYYKAFPLDCLCKCYAEIGKYETAHIRNESFLAIKPTSTQGLFNREFLRDKLYDRLSPRPVRLNLGAGGKPTSGWRNCDLYDQPGVELKMDQSLIPYHDRTVHAIRSEHALEHSDSHYTAEATVAEWARSMRHGAHLKLLLPDAEECMGKFLASEDRPRRDGERWTEREWYKYTLWGIQKSNGSEPAEGQFHRTGFTMPQLRRLLEQNGFHVTKQSKYDGWGTPSLEFEAVQVKNPVRVVWLLNGADENDPSTRIRRMNIHRRLSKIGVESTVMAPYRAVNGQSRDEGALFAIVREYDAVVFTSFSEYDRNVMEKLILSGVSVIADYNEDLSEQNIEIARCLEASSVIVCCSKKLAEKASKYGRTIVIPDAFETREDK